MGHKPEMGAIQPVRLYGEGDQSVKVTPEGRLSVDAQVTAEVADSKIKGSTDAGTTWVPVRVNSSGQLEVTLSGRIGVSLPPAIYLSAHSLSPGGNTTLDVAAVNTPVVIDYLLIVTDSPDIRINLNPRNGGSYVQQVGVRLDTLSVLISGATISQIRDGGSLEFYIDLWDEESNRYIVRNRDPLNWPNGGRIFFANMGNTSARVTAVVRHRLV